MGGIPLFQALTRVPAAAAAALPGRRTSRWAAALRQVARGLAEFAAHSDEPFAAFAAEVDSCRTRAIRLAEAADAVAELASAKVLAQAAAQVETLQEHLRSEADLVDRMGTQVRSLAASLAQVPALQHDFHRTAMALRTLGASTRIESAWLPSGGSEFSALADSVKNLAAQITREFTEVLSRSRSLEGELSRVLSVERQKAHRARLEAVIETMLTGFQELAEGNRRALEVAGQAGRHAQALAQGAARLGTLFGEGASPADRIETLQAGLERVAEALDRRVPGPRGAALAAEAAASVRKGVEALHREFAGAVEGFRRDMEPLGRAVAGLSRGLSEVDAATGGGNASLLSRLREELANLARELADANREVSRVLSFAAKTAGEIAFFLEDVDQVEFQLQLIAINAIVKSCHAGDRGGPLAAIAQEIQSQSAHARRLIAAIARMLRSIEGEARDLQQLARSFVEATEDMTALATEPVEALLGQLQALGGALSRSVEDVKALGERLDRHARNLSGAGSLPRQLDRVVAWASGALGQLASQAHAAAGAVPRGELRAQLAALLPRPDRPRPDPLASEQVGAPVGERPPQPEGVDGGRGHAEPGHGGSDSERVEGDAPSGEPVDPGGGEGGQGDRQAGQLEPVVAE
ncbi:MAG: hypothetical protein Kow0092_04450 [Deferrisomatales bacterium]